MFFSGFFFVVDSEVFVVSIVVVGVVVVLFLVGMDDVFGNDVLIFVNGGGKVDVGNIVGICVGYDCEWSVKISL